MEDTIQPNEFLLKIGETIVVEVTIVMSPERLEMLLEQDSNSKIININKISLVYGDEVSRVRVSRLVCYIQWSISNIVMHNTCIQQGWLENNPKYTNSKKLKSFLWFINI